MSQICRYYLKGTCRYGSSCRYLHDSNYTYNSRSNQENYNYRNNQENYGYKNNQENYGYKNNQENYGYKNNQENYGYKNNQENYGYKNSQENYGYKNNQENYGYKNNQENYNSRNKYYSDQYQSSYKSNYSRYHVDNRQYSQTENKTNDEFTLFEFYEIVRGEIQEFEERHVWPLTVISPIPTKAYGNIPGFKDYSPEEIRYQFYVASNNNTFHEFKRSIDELKENILQFCRLFKSKSTASYDIVKEMMKNPQKFDSISTVFPSQATNSSSDVNFTFDLNTLQKSGSVLAPPSQTSINSANFTNSFGIPQDNIQINSSTMQFDTNERLFSNPVPINSESSLNSFSFNLGNLNNIKTNTVISSQSLFPAQSENAFKSENDSNYSQLNKISPTQMQAFQAKSFTYGKIPLIPPPKDLCR